MKILLTGATGMVGKNLLEHPNSKQHEWLTPSRQVLNLLNREDVFRYLETTKPDLVIHAAGVVGGIQANLREPVRFLTNNLDIGTHLIMGSREAGILRFLNLSCSCMYPRMAPLPMREDSILTGELEPTNEGYALARIVAQRLCEYISREDPRFQYKTLVSSNLYGRHDKFNPQHSHLIPAIIAKLADAKLRQLPTIDIWGDGTARREFMYAGDLADCLLKIVDQFESFPSLANVGPGTEYTINDYYQKIAKVLNYNGEFVHDLTKPTGMARKLVDTSRIHQWGWNAPTSLDAGLAMTIDYYSKNIMEGKLT
jgi:GDP-L-fucose synthase